MSKKKIEFSPDDRIGYLQIWVDQVMEAICRVSGIPDYVYISDESVVDHFPVEKKDLAVLEKDLGVPVKLNDLIVDVAQRMKNAFG
jgi:hypothetical protein